MAECVTKMRTLVLTASLSCWGGTPQYAKPGPGSSQHGPESSQHAAKQDRGEGNPLIYSAFVNT